MNWHKFKILYQIESKRHGDEILSVIVAIMLSFILFQSFFRITIMPGNSFTHSIYSQFNSTILTFFVLLGMTISLLYIIELKSDDTKGIIDTFMTYPINRGDFALAKLVYLITYLTLFVIILTTIFLIFSGTIFIIGIKIAIGFIATLLLTLLCIFSATFISSLFIRLSPISEILIIFYYITGLIVLTTISVFPNSEEFITILYPFFTLAKIITGMPVKGISIILIILSIIMYTGSIYLAYVWINTYKRRALE